MEKTITLIEIARNYHKPSGELKMSWNRIEGNWKQFKGKVKETWGDLTDDEIDQIAGKRDILLGKIQEKYGIAQDEAEKKVKDFEDSLD